MNPGVCPGGKLEPRIAPYCGSHTEWCGILPDYSMPEASAIVADFLNEEVVSKGASGFKMDENDIWRPHAENGDRNIQEYE